MELSPSIAALALPATVLLLLTFLLMRLRQRVVRRREREREVVDTLAGWPPEPVRVLSITERQAYELLRRAMPGFLVMAQVPLARFIRVPSRRSTPSGCSAWARSAPTCCSATRARACWR